MKKMLTIIIASFALNASSQIQITQKNDLPVESENVFQDMDFVNKDSNELEKERFDSIKLGFKNFDINLLMPFLTKGLQSESQQIEEVFSIYTEIFNKNGSTTFEHRSNDGFSQSGTSGLARFINSNRTIGFLEFKYTYWGERPIISEILVINHKVKYEFPLIEGKIQAKLEEIKALSEERNYKEAALKYKELVNLTHNLEDYYHNPNEGLTRRSNYLGNLAWYCLLSGNSKDAIAYADKGLTTWQSNSWICTNLALGYALDGNFEEAERLYSKYGNIWYKRDKHFKDVFLEDLKYLNSLGLNIPRYKEYINLLSKM